MPSSTKTTFSSFKSPRPAPIVPTGPPLRSQTPPLRKVASESSIIQAGAKRGNGELNVELKYDYFAFPHENVSVRQEYVGIQRDKLRSWSWTRKLWLVLDQTRLHFCRKKDSEPYETLKLRQVREVERVDTKAYCLMVAAASTTWYLIFKDSFSLYNWYYDMRNRCPLLRIGHPTDFRHQMHVAYDRAAREITGLPVAWMEALSSGVARGFGTYNHKRPYEPSAATPPTDIPPPPPPKVWGPSEKPPLPAIPGPMLRRSASDSVPPSRAASTILSVEPFRGSPHRYRDVQARDLTGVIHRARLLPTSRHNNCDILKGEWKGAFGTRDVAIQIIQFSEPLSKADLEKLSSLVRREVKALHQLRHPNVVRTRGFCRDHGPLPALVSTWIPGQNIIDYVRHKRLGLNKALKLKLLTEVAAGLNYLHNFSRTIVHGELRGAHVLINNNGRACISGFGLNPILHELAGGISSRPSPRWAAVEVILNGRNKISYASDVFSFARTVLEVMTEKDPYDYLTDDAEIVTAVVRGVPPRRPPVFGDDGLWHFLERCWSEVPSQRPSMSLALLRMEDIHALYHLPTTEDGGQHRPSPHSTPP